MISDEKKQEIQDNLQATQDAYTAINELLSIWQTIWALADPTDSNNAETTDEMIDNFFQSRLDSLNTNVDTAQTALKNNQIKTIK
jgi:hypothetical protein